MLPALLLIFAIKIAFAQDYKLDNKLFKTISWNEFFNRLDKNPDLIYFDIRTAGERDDSSQYSSNNQGRIRGAKQIDYYQFDKYYPELLKFKQDTIYLYCSHSMRSRRLAKQLSDSSFKNVISINGGMSYLNLMGNKSFPLRKKYYETQIKYKLISPFDLETKLRDKNTVVIDVRPDSIYFATGGDEQDKSYGRISGMKHIADVNITDSLSILKKYKEIILLDNYGDISAATANKLIENGFKNVGILFYGLDELRTTVPSSKRKYLKLQYPAILPSELATLKKSENIAIIDIRTTSEFNSKDTVAWKNVGRLKDAVNIPLADLTEQKIEPYRNRLIIIYDNMMMPPELYRSAELLKQFGIKKFALLSGGIFQLKWEIANTENKFLQELLEEN